MMTCATPGCDKLLSDGVSPRQEADGRWVCHRCWVEVRWSAKERAERGARDAREYEASLRWP